MKNFISNHRNIVLVSSYLFLTAVFFLFGLFAGFHGTEKALPTDSAAIADKVNAATPVPESEQSHSHYRVILEDGELRLYIDENGISRLLSSEEISEDSYPVSDIASLKKGIIFEASDGAVSLMENFIS